MSIIWINIWDVQSGSKTKSLINRCFNIGRFIATIWKANMNPGILQCKNCWWWEHATMSCHIQDSRCVKCSGPHKTENYRQYGWCCKANEKTNPPRLKMKAGTLCLYSFKYSNCHRDHQVDSNLCPFWKHRFHHEWHVKKCAKICENKFNSTHSIVNGTTLWIMMF